MPGDYPTIQAALNAASPGDTVSVSPGTYHENLDFQGKDVALVSAQGPSSTAITVTGGTAVTVGPSGSVVGFTLTGPSQSFGYRHAMEVVGSGTLVAHNVFRDTVASSGYSGAAIWGDYASPTIEANVFTNNGCDNQNEAATVSFVGHSSPVIVNNVFHDNACRAIAFALFASDAPLVINNTIVRNSTGVQVTGNVPEATFLLGEVFRNNVIVGNGIGLEVRFGFGPTWDHNLVYGNGTNYTGFSNVPPTTYPDQTGTNGNISADPMFVDSAANDFHLLAGSPTIAAGSAVSAPAVDLDGNGRPTGEVDIGAFQFAAVPSPPGPVAAVPYGDGAAKVIWTRPRSSGGSAITGYRVTPYLGLRAQPPRVFGSAAGTGLVTGLQDGKAYRFVVAARNGTGIGASSPMTGAMIVGAPGQPGRATLIRVASGSFKATFAAPNSNGAAITSYAMTCTSSNGGATKTASGGASPITVAGLTSGMSYTCRVRATNSRGIGPASVPSAAVNA